uniref:Uncharacterized protein n=1 Tax=Meloidogyne enterolobii TaxID=390850 RepID=A0A6V7TN41_MELEN|nr:unnamed protein product [Meloidogyne enterolobii]
MFFSYQILIRKNGNFAAIWRYMHERNPAKVSKKELLSIDISQACTDLRNYVPTGRLDSREIQNKMSLYLLAQLSYGVALVLKVISNRCSIQWFTCLLKNHHSHKGSAERLKLLLQAWSRKTLMMFRWRLLKLAKKRRTTHGTRPSLLDLSDPRSYIDQQVHPRREANELQELDEVFMDTAAGEALPPLDFAVTDEQTGGDAQRKVSVASLLQDREDSFREMERALGIEPIERAEEEINITNGHVEQRRSEGGLPSRETLEDLGPEMPLDETREPIYRQSFDQAEDASFLQNFDELRLELPNLDLDMPPPRGVPHRRRRQVGLLVDEQTQLTDEEIQDQILNIRGVVRNNRDFENEFNRDLRSPLAQLMEPFQSDFLPNEEFRPLFARIEHYSKRYFERPLTFEEAQLLTYEQLQQRRFEVDVDSFRVSEPTPEGSVIQQNGHPPVKVSVASLVLPPEELLEELDDQERRFSTPSAIEIGRRAARETINDLAPLNDSIQEPQHSLDASSDRPLDDDIPLRRESIFTNTKTSPDVPEEDWLDAEMNQLYEVIQEKYVIENVVCFPQAAKVNELGKGEIGRKRAARKFFTLLKLLKHRKVKVRQREPYGLILIRLVRQPGDLDVSMASM